MAVYRGRSTRTLDDMTQIAGPLPIPSQLKWRVFTLSALLMGVIFIALFWNDFGDPAQRPIIEGTGAGIASVLTFLGLRWRALRHDVSSGSLSPNDLRSNLRRHLLGPMRTRVIWFLAIVIGAILWSALTSSWR